MIRKNRKIIQSIRQKNHTFSCFIGIVLLFNLSIFSTIAENSQTSVLSLSEAISNSLEYNRELQAIRRDTNASKLQKRETASAYYPQFSFAFQVLKSDSERFDFDIPSQPGQGTGFDPDELGFTGANWSNTFQFTQLLYDRSVLGAINLADLRMEAAGWQEIGQEQQVVFDTVSAYLDVLRAKELLGVQNQRLLLAKKQLQTATTSFEVGLRIRTDVLRAQLTRSSAMRDVVSAEIALERAQVVLNQVMGLPMVDRHQVKSGALASYTPPEEVETTLKGYDELFQTAEKENPSIKVASTLVKQTHESVSIARGEFYPRISVGGSWGFNDTGGMYLEDEEWSLRAGVEIPLFEGLRKVTKVKRTKEQLEAQRKRYENTIRGVQSLIEQSALALQEERRNLEIALEAAEVAKENHERFLNLYEEGLADSLDVTQALTEKVEADTNVVTTRYGFLKLYAQLIYAVGIIPTEADKYQSMQWLETIE